MAENKSSLAISLDNSDISIETAGNFKISLTQDHLIDAAIQEQISRLQAIDEVLNNNINQNNEKIARIRERQFAIADEIKNALKETHELSSALSHFRSLADSVSQLQGVSKESYGTSMTIESVSVVSVDEENRRNFTDFTFVKDQEKVTNRFALKISLAVENQEFIEAVKINNVLVTSDKAKDLVAENVRISNDIKQYAATQSDLMVKVRDVNEAIRREEPLRRMISASFTKAILNRKITSVADFLDTVEVVDLIPRSVREIYDSIVDQD